MASVSLAAVFCEGGGEEGGEEEGGTRSWLMFWKGGGGWRGWRTGISLERCGWWIGRVGKSFNGGVELREGRRFVGSDWTVYD